MTERTNEAAGKQATEKEPPCTDPECYGQKPTCGYADTTENDEQDWTTAEALEHVVTALERGERVPLWMIVKARRVLAAPPGLCTRKCAPGSEDPTCPVHGTPPSPAPEPTCDLPFGDGYTCDLPKGHSWAGATADSEANQ